MYYYDWDLKLLMFIFSWLFESSYYAEQSEWTLDIFSRDFWAFFFFYDQIQSFYNLLSTFWNPRDFSNHEAVSGKFHLLTESVPVSINDNRHFLLIFQFLLLVFK
jgi:hypothetical protein